MITLSTIDFDVVEAMFVLIHLSRQIELARDGGGEIDRAGTHHPQSSARLISYYLAGKKNLRTRILTTTSEPFN